MKSRIRIVVLQRGWVVVGRVSHGTSVTAEAELVISSASVIRRWGTTKGLGELVTGPKPETKLDPAGLVRVHPLSVVLSIDADEKGWTKYVS